MNLFDVRDVFDKVLATTNQFMKRIVTVSLGVLVSTLVALAADSKKIDVSKLPPAADKKGVTFDKEIKPIFVRSCSKCHGEEKQKGDLRLDSRDATLKGGENGKVVEPGKIDKSLLLVAVAGLDPDMAMPPEGKGERLTKEQVGLVRAWIEQGAK